MPKPRALSIAEAKKSIAHRLGARADRLRQFATKFGIRPYRVFLCWSTWTGHERAEGEERVPIRMELLPTPKLETLSSISYRLMAAGAVPTGDARLSRISVLYTRDQLSGVARPPSQAWVDANNPPAAGTSALVRTPNPPRVGERDDFFVEIAEDGRGDEQPVRERFRVSAEPFRDAANVGWVLSLERVSMDETREGKPTSGFDEV